MKLRAVGKTADGKVISCAVTYSQFMKAVAKLRQKGVVGRVDLLVMPSKQKTPRRPGKGQRGAMMNDGAGR